MSVEEPKPEIRTIKQLERKPLAADVPPIPKSKEQELLDRIKERRNTSQS